MKTKKPLQKYTARAKLLQNKYGGNKFMKYQEWLEEWLESYTKISTKFRTYKRYTEIVHQHIVLRLSDKEMKELTPLDFQHFVTYLLKSGNARTKQGLSANTVNSIITVVQNSLKIAFMLGYVDSYVGDKLNALKLMTNQLNVLL